MNWNILLLLSFYNISAKNVWNGKGSMKLRNRTSVSNKYVRTIRHTEFERPTEFKKDKTLVISRLQENRALHTNTCEKAHWNSTGLFSPVSQSLFSFPPFPRIPFPSLQTENNIKKYVLVRTTLLQRFRIAYFKYF